jgi:hypothetical protein
MKIQKQVLTYILSKHFFGELCLKVHVHGLESPSYLPSVEEVPIEVSLRPHEGHALSLPFIALTTLFGCDPSFSTPFQIIITQHLTQFVGLRKLFIENGGVQGCKHKLIVH